MLLSDNHIDLISERLVKGGIKDKLLHADLLDHICCYLEEQDSDDFDVLLRDALTLLAPNGVHEIEEERYFLFHFHKQLTMKRVLFFSGFATCFLVSTGLTFKLMHWPGANVLLTTGFFGMIVSIMLITVNALSRLKENPVAYNFRVFIGAVAALLIAVGSIFKIFEFPSANKQFVLGMFLLSFIFLPMFFYQLYKRSIAKSL